jgi:class 3 adenylate cyclase/tetratricopeptide (TPR) repeat protein
VVAQELAIVFTDIEGSTELRTRLGDEQANIIFAQHDELVRAELVAIGGRELNWLGDGFLLAFASTDLAIRFAVGLQSALADSEDQGLFVRVGIHFGPVTEHDGMVSGVAINAASRIMGKAQGGEILVSEIVAQASSAEVTFVDRGSFWLKGFPGRWKLFQALWAETEARPRPIIGQRTPLVGREKEGRELRRLLDDARGGSHRIGFLVGEAGVGKSRLVEETSNEAAVLGLNSLVARCNEGTGIPFEPFVRIMEALREQRGADGFRRLMSRDAPAVAQLLPELRRVYADIEPWVDVGAESERRFVFSGWLAVICRAAREQALLLAFEDVQWSEESTLLWLEYLADNLSSAPLLLLVSARVPSLESSAKLGRLAEVLLRHGAQQIEVTRFGLREVREMLEAMSGSPPPEAVAEAVLAHTGGNAYFVEEVGKHLLAQQRGLDSSGRWRQRLPLAGDQLPASLRTFISSRLNTLDARTRAVMVIAAALGGTFSFEVLERLSQLQGHATIAALDEAERESLIAADVGERAASDASFTFVHDLVRQVLLDELTTSRRWQLHAEIADVIEGLLGQDGSARAFELAHHLRQAGPLAEPKRLRKYLVIAGNAATESFGFEVAADLFEEALGISIDDHLDRPDLLFRLGLARLSCGDLASAMEPWREALQLSEVAGDVDAVERLSVVMTRQLLWSARWFEVFEVSQRALTAVGDRESWGKCQLMVSSATTLSGAGFTEMGGAILDEAEGIAERIGDAALVADIQVGKSIHFWLCMEMDQAVAMATPDMKGHRRSGDLLNTAQYVSLVRYAHVLLGQLDSADHLGEEFDPLAARLGHPGILLVSERARGTSELLRTGNLDRFLSFVRRDRELCLSRGLPWISHSWIWEGVVELWRGRWTEAVIAFQRSKENAFIGFGMGAEAGYLCIGLAYAGAREAALDLLHESAELLPDPAAINTIGKWTMLHAAVEAMAVLNEQEELERLAPLMELALTNSVVLRWPTDRLCETVAGMSASARGEWRAAEEHYARAMRLAEAVPHRVEQAEVRRLWAEMLVRRGRRSDRVGAAQLAGEARTLYGRLGMPRHETLCAETLMATALSR